MSEGRKVYKLGLIATCIVLLVGVGQVQRSLVRERNDLGLVRVIDNKGMPPVLAFTTVALGGFRGLIANALWIRMNDLQENDRYFEMVQLADWITKLEPHFTQVWLVQGWNMAYNVSVKFKDPEDRWRWVQRGIQLLRDDGLRFNPDETLIYREISWFYQHKMGQNLDDAHWHYKLEWKKEMESVFGKKPNFDALLNPKTDDDRRRVALLKETYKLDPQLMKEVDEKYGPVEWRLPEAHAIYWAELGRRKGKEKDQNTLMRSIYQTMQQSFRRGAIFESKIDGSVSLVPNLDAMANVNRSYEDPMTSKDEEIRDQPKRGHKNFLLEAVTDFYLYNRVAEAQKWYDYLNEKYPDAVPSYLGNRLRTGGLTNIALQDFIVIRLTENMGDTDVNQTTAMIEGLIQQSFIQMVEDEDAQAVNTANLALRIKERYDSEIKGAEIRIKLPPIEKLRERALAVVLDPERGLPPEAAARLRTKLGLPLTPPPATNKVDSAAAPSQVLKP